MTPKDIIELLEQTGENRVLFHNLVLKTHPHSDLVPIHEIFKDEMDNEWTVSYGHRVQYRKLAEIKQIEFLATIYQRLKLQNK